MSGVENVSPQQFGGHLPDLTTWARQKWQRRLDYDSARDAAAWGEGPSVEYDEAIEKDRSR